MTSDLATILSLVSLVAVVLGAGRSFFVVESRQADHTDRLRRLEGYAEEFNGPARSRHTELMGRVSSLEAQITRYATTESVQAIAAEMRQGFKHLEELIKSERRQRHEDNA